MKKYCECFQAKVPCSDQCKCIECRNYGFLTKEHFLKTTRGDEKDFLCKVKSNKRLITTYKRLRSLIICFGI